MSHYHGSIRPKDLLTHSDWAFALARRLVRDDATADDVVQDTFAAALKSPPREEGPLRPWLSRVLGNVVRQRARGEGRRSYRERVSARRESLPSAAELTERTEAHRLLTEVLLELDEAKREVVLLRYYEGMSAAEIARSQNVPQGTVRWRLKAGLDELRARLDARFDGDRERWWLALAPLTADTGATAGVAASLLISGGLLMKLALATVSITALLLLALFLTDDEETKAQMIHSDEVAEVESSPELQAEDRGVAAPEESTPVPLAERAEIVAVPDASAAPPGEPRCVVRGRIADQEGRGLRGVRIRLFAYKVWAEGVDLPRVDERYDLRGFEVHTDATGAFEIAAPPPTNKITTLRVEPDPYHDSHRISFNSERDDAEPSLSEGARDLGEIRLTATGALRGRVVDTQGEPIADADIDVGPGRSTTYSRSTRSEVDGTFLLGHAPIGTYAIKAKVEGYLSGYIEPVTVIAGRDNGGHRVRSRERAVDRGDCS